ncbi:MAG: hypothetical protein JWM33_2651, partial [Caulobacteraceae bacterium]|nr:hypothetical protein [Caulobacteraceae bacterium]
GPAPPAGGGRGGGRVGASPASVLDPTPVKIQPGADHEAVGRIASAGLASKQGGWGRLDAVMVVYPSGQTIGVDIWSRTVTGAPDAENAVRDAVGDWMQGEMLRKAGIDPALAGALQNVRPAMQHFSTSGQELSFRNARLPSLVSFGLAMALFILVMAGTGILLNGVIEEKSSRILEVLLTSAEPREILFGKILGAAGVAGTLVLLWMVMGGVILATTQPETAQAVGALMFGRGLIFYFLLYLVGGYVMFAAIITAVGSFCETTREAQSLLGPLMMLLMLPVVVMSQVLLHPDLPLLAILSWVPNFTPFLMMARAASSPPLWQVIGTAVEMAVTTSLVVWAAGRAFRTGALTSGKVTLASIIAKVRHGD